MFLRQKTTERDKADAIAPVNIVNKKRKSDTSERDTWQ